MNTALEVIVVAAAILIAAGTGMYQAVEMSTLRVENEILREQIALERQMLSNYFRLRHSGPQKPPLKDQSVGSSG